MLVNVFHMVDDDSQPDTESELRERFAVAPLLDLEIDVGGSGLVGLAARASHSLRVNVTASVLAEQIGYASIDYVRKRYLKNMEEHPARDKELRFLSSLCLIEYDKFYHGFQPPRSDAPLGVFAFDLAMVRGRGTLELIVILARQGFLLETCVVARSLMEQLAYAAYVWDKTNDKQVFDTKPQSLIKHLFQVTGEAGRAYGLLSQLSHYDPHIHYHFIGDPQGETTVQRSWRFKIIASGWAFYMHWLYAKVFERSYSDYSHFGSLKGIPNALVDGFDKHFAGIDNFWLAQIRNLIRTEAPTRE